MKVIYKVSVILSVLFAGVGCQDITVGYLMTRNAKYTPDSLIVKAVLDPVTDARRIQFRIPWQSTAMEGVQGTSPVRYSIRGIGNEHAESLSQFRMYGKGIIELPYDHTVPVGRYVIDLRIENEGYMHDLDSVFTVIVK